MQQIEVDKVGAQPAEAPLAHTLDSNSGRVPGLHFGDQKNALAQSGDRATKEFLGMAVAIIFGCGHCWSPP